MREAHHTTQRPAEDEQEVVAQLHLLWRFYHEPRAATMELFPGEQSGLMVDVAHARWIIAETLGTASPLYVLLDTALRLNALPALRGALQTFTGYPFLLDDREPCLSYHNRTGEHVLPTMIHQLRTGYKAIERHTRSNERVPRTTLLSCLSIPIRSLRDQLQPYCALPTIPSKQPRVGAKQ